MGRLARATLERSGKFAGRSCDFRRKGAADERYEREDKTMETMMEVMKMIDLTPLFEVLIALLASVLTLKVLPLIRSKLTAQQQEMLKGTIRTLVYAAEQVYGSGFGQDKMFYVAEKLRERGFEVDLAAIEAAVREMTMFGGTVSEEKTEEEYEDAFGSEGACDRIGVSDLKNRRTVAADAEHTQPTWEMNLLAWTPEQLKEFCGVNGIACEGCETAEEYFYAIVAKGREACDEEPVDVE